MLQKYVYAMETKLPTDHVRVGCTVTINCHILTEEQKNRSMSVTSSPLTTPFKTVRVLLCLYIDYYIEYNITCTESV